MSKNRSNLLTSKNIDNQNLVLHTRIRYLVSTSSFYRQMSYILRDIFKDRQTTECMKEIIKNNFPNLIKLLMASVESGLHNVRYRFIVVGYVER